MAKTPRSKTKRRLLLVQLNRLLRRHEALMLRSIGPALSAGVRWASETPEDLAGVQARLTDLLRSRYRSRATAAAMAFGAATVTSVKSAHGLEVKDPTLAEVYERAFFLWLEEYGLERVTTIARGVIDRVREVLVEAAEEGLGQEDAARRIRSVVGQEYAQWRAARVARTEAHIAANLGSDLAARATGLPMTKEWLSAEDDRTRPSHSEADGQSVGIDDPFVVGGALLMYPGDPSGPAREVINCRCVSTYSPRY